MKIFKFFRLNFLIIMITALIPWLKKQGGWFYPIFLFKIFSFLYSFLIKAQKVGFIKMVKYIYYFLSVFNVLLAVFIITNFSDFALNPKILEIMKNSLELLIPFVILESINIFIEDLGLTFKNIIKRIMDWVYTSDGIDKTIPDKTSTEVVNSKTLPIDDKLRILTSFKKNLDIQATDIHFAKKSGIFSEATNYLQNQIQVENILSTSTPSIPSTSTFIPDYIFTSTSSSNPTSFVTPSSPSVSTGSITPQNISSGSATPTGTLTPKGGFFTPINSPAGSSVTLPSISSPKLSVTIPTNIPVLPTSTEMVRFDHSPVLEAIPKDIWDPFKSGGKLKSMFASRLSPSDYPITFNWPEGHISPYDSTTRTPIDISAPNTNTDNYLDELAKKND